MLGFWNPLKTTKELVLVPAAQFDGKSYHEPFETVILRTVAGSSNDMGNGLTTFFYYKSFRIAVSMRTTLRTCSRVGGVGAHVARTLVIMHPLKTAKCDNVARPPNNTACYLKLLI